MINFGQSFVVRGCSDLQGHHGRQQSSLCDHHQKSEQPQNAKIRSKLNKNVADFRSRFFSILYDFCSLRMPWRLQTTWQPLWPSSEVRTASKGKNLFKIKQKRGRFSIVVLLHFLWLFALWEWPGLQGHHGSLCRQYDSLCSYPQKYLENRI